MSVNDAIKWLEEASLYFQNRDTHGEDMAYWSNVYNAENCKQIIELLTTRSKHDINNLLDDE